VERPASQLLLGGTLVLAEVEQAQRELATVPPEAFDGGHLAGRLELCVVSRLQGLRQAPQVPASERW